MHSNGPFGGESQLNFKKYESTYLIHNFKNTELKIIPVRHKCDPIKTFYHSVLPTEDDNTIQQQKAKPMIWQSYTKGPCRNTLSQSKHNTTK